MNLICVHDADNVKQKKIKTILQSAPTQNTTRHCYFFHLFQLMFDIVKFWSSHEFLHLNKYKKSTNSSVGNGGCIHDVYYM